MWQVFGVSIDLVHALLMAAWVLGLPLLFWHRWPRWTRAYGIYAIAFIVVSQGSHLLLGECVLTTIARAVWHLAPLSGGPSAVSEDWFTVRLAEAIFHLAPSHRAVVLVSDALILVSAVGVLSSHRHLPLGRKRTATPTRVGRDASQAVEDVQRKQPLSRVSARTEGR